MSSLEEFGAYTVTYLIVSEMIRSYLYGDVRWPWVSELYEYLQSVYLLRAIISVFLSPRHPKFNVTAKGEQISSDRLSEVSLPYFIIFGVFCVTMFVCAYRYQTEPELSGLLAVVGIWQFVNLVIAGAALGVVTERTEKRLSPRMPNSFPVELAAAGEVYSAVLSNISSTGAKIALAPDAVPHLRKGEPVALRLLDGPTELSSTSILSTLVNFGEEKNPGLGVRFELATEDYPALAHMMLADMTPVREQRRQRQRGRTMVRASMDLLIWAITSPFRAVWLALTGGRKPEKPESTRTPQRQAAAKSLNSTSMDVA